MRALLIVFSVWWISFSWAAEPKMITGKTAESIYLALSVIDGHIGVSSHFVDVPRINEKVANFNNIASFAGLYCFDRAYVEGRAEAVPLCMFGEMDLEQFQKTKAILAAVGLITEDQRRTLRRASQIIGDQAKEMYTYIIMNLNVEVSRGLPRGEHMWAWVIDILGMRCVERNESFLGSGVDLKPYAYECRLGENAQVDKINALLKELGIDYEFQVCKSNLRRR